jgi:hypothetical protein
MASVIASYGASYFAELRAKEAAFWQKIKAIRSDGYATVEEAAIGGLRRIWYRSWLEGVEWGGALYKKGAAFGVGTPQTTKLGFAVIIRAQGPTGATFQGLYHTHVNVPGGSPERLSGHDRDMAKQIGGPVYVATPAGAIIEVRPGRSGLTEHTIGKIEAPPMPEVYRESRPPDAGLRALLEEHRKWRLSQLP